MSEKPDILKAAARALHEETESQTSAARFTRLRVMASVREREVRRRTQTVLLLPFAACLGVASAWGMAVGGVTEMRRAVVDALGLDAPPAPAPSASARPNPRRRAPRAVTPPPSPAETPPPPPAPAEITPTEPPAPPPGPALEVTPPPRSLRSPSAALDNRAPYRPAPPPDRAHELYRTAHRAHFGAQDWQAALTAWDAYLAAAPRGRFATEARYNRALCLARLGRTSEARRALAPFAEKPGSYRHSEAAALRAVLPEN